MRLPSVFVSFGRTNSVIVEREAATVRGVGRSVLSVKVWKIWFLCCLATNEAANARARALIPSQTFERARRFMNLIILDSDEGEMALPKSGQRAQHVLEVLRRKVGDDFDVGHPDGRMGKARVEEIGRHLLRISVAWTGKAPLLQPVTVIVGMPRPQTARRLLRELTTLGVRRLVFCDTDRSEPGYKTSKLWTTREFDRHIRAGAEQAFNPRLPELTVVSDLAAAIELIDNACERLGMDNYESPASLTTWAPKRGAATIALGAERGWSSSEREELRRSGFSLFHLGERVLRLETAAVACVSIVLSRMGRI